MAEPDGQTTPIQRRAFDLIREAVSLAPAESRGQFWRQFVLTDRVMTFLRRNPEFSRLNAEFSTPASATGPPAPGEK